MRRYNRKKYILIGCLIILILAVMYLFQSQAPEKLKSIRTSPRGLTNLGGAAPQLMRLPSNLTAAYDRIKQLSEEIKQLHDINRNFTSKFTELRALYQEEHFAFLQLKNNWNTSSSSLPTIFVITPTYARHTQEADLVRLSQTLSQVRNLHWIIVEDSAEKSQLLTHFVNSRPMAVTHLNYKTSEKMFITIHTKHGGTKRRLRARGVEQRNLALQWLRQNYKLGEVRGVVYFGDDDNTYDLRVFEEMRYTAKASVWPVGLIGGLVHEGPACENGKVIGWNSSTLLNRTFLIDFAGLAVNIDVILRNESVLINVNSKSGYLENDFLSQVVNSTAELEARADDCTKIYVWHTQTKTPYIDNSAKVFKELRHIK